MSAPIAKGIIIAASVIVAAGLAIYENEQIRVWLDEHRRRIAVAFYALGDGISPSEMEMRSPAQQAELAEKNRERRLEIVRRNKRELIERAREQGIAVDLDQLVALNIEEEDASEQLPEKAIAKRQNSGGSFDDIIGADGKLKSDPNSSEMTERPAASTSAFHAASGDGLRQRGVGTRGFEAGAAFANPFDDDAHILYDRDMSTDVPTVRSISPRPEPELEPRGLDVPVTRSNVVDIPITELEPAESDAQTQYKTEAELEAEIEEAIRRSLQDEPPLLIDVHSPASSHTLQHPSIPQSSSSSLTDSLYDPPSPRAAARQSPSPSEDSLYAASSPRRPQHSLSNSSNIPPTAYHSGSSSFHSAISEDLIEIDAASDGERTPSGAMTPTDDGFSTISSAVGHAAPDIAVLADLEPITVPRRTNSAGARSVAAESADSFSVVGATTPLTWSEVDSESETEAGNGERHVFRR